MPTTQIIPNPSQLEKKSEEEKVLEPLIYCLDYKSNGKVWHKYFKFTGNLTSAIERAKAHCLVMNYWFINVSIHVVDLDIQERQYLHAQSNAR